MLGQRNVVSQGKLQLKVGVYIYSILLMCAAYNHITAMLCTGKEADEVLKVNHEQLQLTIKEIEQEIESLGSTFTFESYTPEVRDKLAKLQVH